MTKSTVYNSRKSLPAIFGRYFHQFSLALYVKTLNFHMSLVRADKPSFFLIHLYEKQNYEPLCKITTKFTTSLQQFRSRPRKFYR